jgi:hypothetical protein
MGMSPSHLVTRNVGFFIVTTERRARDTTNGCEPTQPEITRAYLPVLTKLTQSPWFLNFRGIVKTCQPPFLH